MRKSLFAFFVLFVCAFAHSQNCPTNSVSISASPNTYYPGTSATVATGATSITIGAAYSGAMPISIGDQVLIIQMQGAYIDSINTAAYGSGNASNAGKGYKSDANLLAGNMEFGTAANAVALSGGTLILNAGTKMAHRNANYSTTSGQYRYQVIRVGQSANITLTDSIKAPIWNGQTGGIVVLSATNTLNMNGKVVSAYGAGFRGGGGVSFSAGSGPTSVYATPTSNRAHGSKGEGLAGTPRYCLRWPQ
ncbi:MAG: hypothetical protein EOO61_12520 [Hymenobacter sp.]|nr:MAG: hypothetical protein EOO61_12520 [Hymenobacter sp.]